MPSSTPTPMIGYDMFTGFWEATAGPSDPLFAPVYQFDAANALATLWNVAGGVNLVGTIPAALSHAPDGTPELVAHWPLPAPASPSNLHYLRDINIDLHLYGVNLYGTVELVYADGTRQTGTNVSFRYLDTGLSGFYAPTSTPGPSDTPLPSAPTPTPGPSDTPPPSAPTPGPTPIDSTIGGPLPALDPVYREVRAADLCGNASQFLDPGVFVPAGIARVEPLSPGSSLTYGLALFGGDFGYGECLLGDFPTSSVPGPGSGYGSASLGFRLLGTASHARVDFYGGSQAHYVLQALDATGNVIAQTDRMGLDQANITLEVTAPGATGFTFGSDNGGGPLLRRFAYY